MLDPFTMLSAVLTAASLPAAVAADGPAPFAIRNQNPFVLPYGLPPLAGDAVPPGRWELRASFDLANNSRRVEGAAESLAIDGETYRLVLSARHAWSSWLETGIDVPLVFHEPGVLDGFIEGWHDLFGLSNAERGDGPPGVLDYSYRRDGVELAAVRSGVAGPGDVRLFASAAILGAGGGPRTLRLHASLELPTGDPDRLLGSGSADVALSLGLVERGLAGRGLTAFAQAGILAPAAGGLLAEVRRPRVLFGSGALAWRALRWLDLVAQLDGHGSVYDSDVAPLGAASVQLTAGGALRLGEATRLDLALGENLFTDTIPDLHLHVALSHRR